MVLCMRFSVWQGAACLACIPGLHVTHATLLPLRQVNGVCSANVVALGFVSPAVPKDEAGTQADASNNVGALPARLSLVGWRTVVAVSPTGIWKQLLAGCAFIQPERLLSQPTRLLQRRPATAAAPTWAPSWARLWPSLWWLLRWLPLSSIAAAPGPSATLAPLPTATALVSIVCRCCMRSRLAANEGL